MLLPPASLRRLSSLCGERGAGGVAALREAGRIAGAALHDALPAVEAAAGEGADRMSLVRYWTELRRVAVDLGYGRPEYEVLAADVGRVELRGSPEASAPSAGERTAPRAGCHFAAGWLGGALSAAAGEPVSVLEVACGAGSEEPRCRFVVGERERLEEIRTSMRAGASVEEAL